MLKYVSKRLLYMIITLWVVITITFFLMHAMPGDPLASLARELPPQVKANYYAKYGLDKSVPQQYVLFLKNLCRGDLGESLKYPGRSVTDTIAKHAPVSGRLGIQAISIGVVIGIVLGIIAAFKRNRWPDHLVMFIAILGVCLPSFVLAALLQYVLSVKFELFPTAGWGTGKHTVLPTIALCFGSIATYARYMRSSVLDVINQDYILTAKAKGISEFNLIVKHVIRNAIIPAITILAPQIANVFTGSFVIENIFAIPGLGSNLVDSINNRDFSMIMGLTIFYCALYIISLLIVDILYGIVDPRIRFSDDVQE
ncbi:oligopeptide transport system permease protein [Keratinibaculum paraultunense]|uniref:Oligopeptide transport system permease protein n=1 Tax=Keratinibaculum paraultunense TaxID=1278232 RepID=A0A4R3KQ47_9FIRM|nr:ABC transporter permease [Keratinibaculum paraultunense]QQY79325.1 ABC transporter permease [Keratinibaculum paraultunense]QQY79330.1 ABC transporter permease [Keratinibaculum paraultunense]TCS86651.1 oligopeptide transport system permease protein [Keratinibaculum paraultunense]